MNLTLPVIIIILTISSCKEKGSSNPSIKKFVQLTIKEDNISPTVDIKDFILITNNAAADTADARDNANKKKSAHGNANKR